MLNVIFKTFKNSMSKGTLKLSLVFLALSLVLFGFSLNQTTPRSHRKILSTLIFSDTQGEVYQILKIKNELGINIEIFHMAPNKLPNLTSKFENIGSKDGYFVLGGTGTNLAMFDIDHDLKLEILVPSFDKNLSAKLDIIKFDEASKKFIIFGENQYSSF